MGTFDHLIISMGIHLARIHGRENVVVVSADNRLTDILAKCKSGIKRATLKRLRIDIAEEVSGMRFEPELFPMHVNLKSARECDMSQVFGAWPIPVGRVRDVYRYIE